MIGRLLTVAELNRLISLGYFEHYEDNTNTAWLTYKAQIEFKNLTHSLGYFHISDLKKHQNEIFLYPSIDNDYSLLDDFRIVNYKFYCFWKKILNSENNFKRIKI